MEEIINGTDNINLIKNLLNDNINCNTKDYYSTKNKVNTERIEIENKIIEKLCNLIIITQNPLDYILIDDILSEFKEEGSADCYKANKIKKIIFKYLKNNVNINKSYMSRVFGKYNKRGYTYIRWKDESKYVIENTKHYHFNKHYDLIKLLENKKEREDFIRDNKYKINDINWPPINMIFYLNVLIIDQSIKIEELKEQVNNIIKPHDITVKNEKPIIKTIISKKSDNDFEEFLNINLIFTANEKDILYTEDIMNIYDSTIDLKQNRLFAPRLKKYILEKYCNNNKEYLEKHLEYRKLKRGYRCFKIKT